MKLHQVGGSVGVAQLPVQERAQLPGMGLESQFQLFGLHAWGRPGLEEEAADFNDKGFHLQRGERAHISLDISGKSPDEPPCY